MHISGFLCQQNVFNPPLETVNCSSVLRASVVNVPDSSCPTASTTYAVGFHLNGRFLELYRSCYDQERLALQHSIYKTYRYVKSAVRPIPIYFSMDKMINGAQARSYQQKLTQACLVTNLGANQPDCIFDRGHVTPSSAFTFSEFRKATDKYLNIVPQYREVNRNNWKFIETWVTNLVRGNYDNPTVNNVRIPRTYDVLKVCTGVLGVHTLKHNYNNKMISIYLMEDKIPVPKWMYKIVSHLSGDKWVMLTYNDVKVPSSQDLYQICDPINCHPGLYLHQDGVGYTVCCNPYKFIKTNIPHLTGIC